MKHKFVIEIETLTSESYKENDIYFLNTMFSKLNKVISETANDKLDGVGLSFVSIKRESFVSIGEFE